MPGITLLFDAIERYYASLDATDPEASTALAELQAWFESRDRAHPEAFERFCRDYELDPDAVRRVLRRALRRKETLGRIDTPET